MTASKNDILNCLDWDYHEFDVHQWGRVRIRALSAAERLELVSQYGSGQLTNEQASEFFCKLIAMSVVDEQGGQVFDLNGDVQALSKRNWNRIESTAKQIMAFNGMGKEGDEKN